MKTIWKESDRYGQQNFKFIIFLILQSELVAVLCANVGDVNRALCFRAADILVLADAGRVAFGGDYPLADDRLCPMGLERARHKRP